MLQLLLPTQCRASRSRKGIKTTTSQDHRVHRELLLCTLLLYHKNRSKSRYNGVLSGFLIVIYSSFSKGRKKNSGDTRVEELNFPGNSITVYNDMIQCFWQIARNNLNEFSDVD